MKIGVIGYMASGKSFLCHTLQRKYAFEYISADEIVRELTSPNGAAYTHILSVFPQYFDENRLLKRTDVLRDLIFNHQWIIIAHY